jgi:asparagine synthetase B (glutamine-hydrolysing)
LDRAAGSPLGQRLIAGDATLYYLRDLRRRLAVAGWLPRDPNSGALVAAALDTWGDTFARCVEGDYAFIIYDRRRTRLLLARDPAGKRPLAWTRLNDGTVVVASSPNALVAYPGVSAEYDLSAVVAAAAGFMGRGDRTAFAAVHIVMAGQTLVHEARPGVRTADQWVAPEFSDDWAGEPSADDADQLRALLEEATCERLPERGWRVLAERGSDSTAVPGAGVPAWPTWTVGCRLTSFKCPFRRLIRVTRMMSFVIAVHWRAKPLIIDNFRRAGKASAVQTTLRPSRKKSDA